MWSSAKTVLSGSAKEVRKRKNPFHFRSRRIAVRFSLFRHYIEAKLSFAISSFAGVLESTVTRIPAVRRMANRSGRMRRQNVRLVFIKRAFASMREEFMNKVYYINCK